MKERIVLKNSPIVETWLVVDFDSDYVPTLSDFQEFVKANYANAISIGTISERQVNVNVKDGVRSEHIVEDAAAGISFMVSGDEQTLIVAKKRRIEIRALGKYPSWDEFIEKANAHYIKCAAFLKPSKIIRVAVKSINRIEIPDGVKRFADVITTIPQDADGDLASVCAEFMYRDTQYYPDFKSFATVVRAYQRQPNTAKIRAPLFYDIEVFKTPENDGEVLAVSQDHLDKLHELKNAIFFGSLAPKQLEMYK